MAFYSLIIKKKHRLTLIEVCMAFCLVEAWIRQ